MGRELTLVGGFELRRDGEPLALGTGAQRVIAFEALGERLLATGDLVRGVLGRARTVQEAVLGDGPFELAAAFSTQEEPSSDPVSSLPDGLRDLIPV